MFEKLNESFFQYHLDYTNKCLLSITIAKGSNIDVFLQLSNNFLNTRGTVSVLQNTQVDRELQKPIKQNFPKIVIQSMDDVCEQLITKYRKEIRFFL